MVVVAPDEGDDIELTISRADTDFDRKDLRVDDFASTDFRDRFSLTVTERVMVDVPELDAIVDFERFALALARRDDRLRCRRSISATFDRFLFRFGFGARLAFGWIVSFSTSSKLLRVSYEPDGSNSSESWSASLSHSSDTESSSRTGRLSTRIETRGRLMSAS